MKTGITHFSDKSVLWFVAAAAVAGVAAEVYRSPPNTAFDYATAVGVGGVVWACIGLLLWGATMPLFAWVKYYRTVRGFSLARSLLIVGGALLSVGLVFYAFIWATQDMLWVSLIIAIGSLINLFFAPWAIARERRYHASLSEIDVNAKRLK